MVYCDYRSCYTTLPSRRWQDYAFQLDRIFLNALREQVVSLLLGKLYA